MGLLRNKVAFVTGGGSGIGRGAALRFAEEGAPVAVADVDGGDGEKVVREIVRKGGRAVFARCDVSDDGEVKAAIEAAVKRFRRLDIVFANAGINGVWAPIEELEPAEWDRTLNTNLKGTYLTLHHAIPFLRKAGGGSVIITSSVNGTRSFTGPGAAAYSSSKAGQVAFMKMAAIELARDGIRVNAVCPGAIETHIEESTTRRDIEKVAVRAKVDQSAFLHDGKGRPRDVADVCVFLASEMARHVTGVEIFVDGGASLAC